jgi:hypothetical protein
MKKQKANRGEREPAGRGSESSRPGKPEYRGDQPKDCAKYQRAQDHRKEVRGFVECSFDLIRSLKKKQGKSHQSLLCHN